MHKFLAAAGFQRLHTERRIYEFLEKKKMESLSELERNKVS